MRERDARNRYLLELFGALLFYAAIMFATRYVGKTLEPGAARNLLLLSPAIPILLMVWVIARQFGRMDEFVRLRSLENLAIATAVTAGLSFTYGTMESSGLPKLSMTWVWVALGFLWGAVGCLRCWVTK